MTHPLNDKQIKEIQPVSPFLDHLVDREGVISYGLGSYGYDIRLGREFKVLPTTKLSENKRIDPKNPSDMDDLFVDWYGQTVEIPPNSYALGESLEEFDMPRGLIGIALGKSTYARSGVDVNITPVEPGWKGYLTIELSNNTPYPVVVHAREGIAQVVFFEGDEPQVSYADREGKYQQQKGVTMAKVDRDE